jgi:hypothetical protein
VKSEPLEIYHITAISGSSDLWVKVSFGSARMILWRREQVSAGTPNCLSCRMLKRPALLTHALWDADKMRGGPDPSTGIRSRCTAQRISRCRSRTGAVTLSQLRIGLQFQELSSGNGMRPAYQGLATLSPWPLSNGRVNSFSKAIEILVAPPVYSPD